MTAAAAVFATLAILLAAWSYLVYPRVIVQRARLVPANDEAPAVLPPASVDVLISAHDEEPAIGARVANVLTQSYPGHLSTYVGCDGCSDATAARAAEAGGSRVRVQEFGNRRGKAAVLNDLVASSSADVLVFTDANSEFEPDAISRLAAALTDPQVGAVCGQLVFAPASGEPTPETEFWNAENRSKEAEGRLGVCLGANGAIYAARRQLVRPLPEGTALDDFLIPARIAAEGHRVVYAPDAVARERPPAEVKTELARRFRIGVGAGAILVRERWLFDGRRRPQLAFVYFSRKVARWLAPVSALAALLCALFVPGLRAAALGVSAALAIVLATALLRPERSGRPGRLYYFVVMNLALAAGVVAGLLGYRRPAWARTAR